VRPETALTSPVSAENPLRVIVAGGGVGGLTLANALAKNDRFDVKVVEKTAAFRRFGGPIQLASNALQVFRHMDGDLAQKIESAATYTGDKVNGIKDGIRGTWYAKFDLKTPAEVRDMQYTCVVDRSELQNILLKNIQDKVSNGAGIESYKTHDRGVTAQLADGSELEADVLIGADGIWSNVRGTMRDAPVRGDGSGVSYSGYVVYAGELKYDSFDNGEVGYKVYIGPNQYFVITDIGNGEYQWYAFLARDPGSADTEPMPSGKSSHLQGIFEGWSEEIHDILRATKEDEIGIRDLYDRPPTALRSWNDDSGRVTLMGDAVHAMMPNLGQGGCQAIEDALVITEELEKLETREQSGIRSALKTYQNRRKARSAAVQGLSRFASDIIIKGFDTPASVKLPRRDEDGTWHGFEVEHGSYNGFATRVLQPVLPVFFSIQFNFLYSGWKNEKFALEPVRDLLVIGPGVILGGLALEALVEGEGLVALQGLVDGLPEELLQAFQNIFPEL
jgi:zeaxanthin epoxidase